MENDKQAHLPDWAVSSRTVSSSAPNADFPALLGFALTNYGKQIDWFLQHRESGIKNLGAILLAESTLMGLYGHDILGVPAREPLFAPIIGCVLATLGIASPVFAWLAILSCQRSFGTAMENTMMMAKVAWAMGIADQVVVRVQELPANRLPGRHDKSLYVPSWLEKCSEDESSTTEKYKKRRLRDRENTYFMTKIVLTMMGVAATVIGLLCAGVVLSKG